MRGRAMATGAMDADSISRAYPMGVLMRRRWAHRPPLDGKLACVGLRLNKQVVDSKGFIDDLQVSGRFASKWDFRPEIP